MLADFHSIYHHQLSVSGILYCTEHLALWSAQWKASCCSYKRNTNTGVGSCTSLKTSPARSVHAACGGRVADEAPELEGGERKALEELIG